LKPKEKTTNTTNVRPQECVGKEEIPAESFTGHARIAGRRVRKEIEGRLAAPAPTAKRKVMSVSYADAVRARRE
jgi:hypothetical protein